MTEATPQFQFPERLRQTAYANYLSTPLNDASPGMTLWNESMIGGSTRSSYILAAGSCAAEAALHPDLNVDAEDGKRAGVEERQKLISVAASYWRTALQQEIDTPLMTLPNAPCGI